MKNPKTQIPNPKQVPKPKTQRVKDLEFGPLGFGDWDLRFPAALTLCRKTVSIMNEAGYPSFLNGNPNSSSRTFASAFLRARMPIVMFMPCTASILSMWISGNTACSVRPSE